MIGCGSTEDGFSGVGGRSEPPSDENAIRGVARNADIQGFPGPPGFQALQRAFGPCSTYPLGINAAAAWALRWAPPAGYASNPSIHGCLTVSGWGVWAQKSPLGAGGLVRWRWDFLNPLVLNGFRGFWHCHVPPRANGLLRAGVEPATDSQAPVGAMWRSWSLASQIQGFFGCCSRETLHNSTPFVLAASVFSPGEFPVASGTGFCPPTSV